MEERSKFLPLLIICSTLFACTHHEAILAWIDEHELTIQQYQNYLNLKNQDDSDENADDYIQSEALTVAIEQSPLYQTSLLETEARENYKTWLLERYLALFLQQSITDQSIQDFYHSDENPFVEPKVEAAHILIRTSNKMSLDERRKAYDKANDIYQRIKRGEDFAQLASQFSDDSLTASKGGSLGFLSENDINKQFSDTAFKKLAPGETSKPFQSRFGFHILRVTAEQRMEKKPLDAVRSQIVSLLEQSLREKEIHRLMSTVKIAKP